MEPNSQNCSGGEPPDPLLGVRAFGDRADEFGIRIIAPTSIRGSCQFCPQQAPTGHRRLGSAGVRWRGAACEQQSCPRGRHSVVAVAAAAVGSYGFVTGRFVNGISARTLAVRILASLARSTPRAQPSPPPRCLDAASKRIDGKWRGNCQSTVRGDFSFLYPIIVVVVVVVGACRLYARRVRVLRAQPRRALDKSPLISKGIRQFWRD